MYSSLYFVIAVSLLLGLSKRAQPKQRQNRNCPRRLPAIRKHLVCQATIECSEMRGREGVSAIHRPDRAIEISKKMNAA
jgi:hypothetical protein